MFSSGKYQYQVVYAAVLSLCSKLLFMASCLVEIL